MYVLAAARLTEFIEWLADAGYDVIGPRFSDGAVRYGSVASSADLPYGIRVRQGPGFYRTTKGVASYFSYVMAPQSWKRQFFRPDAVVFRTEERSGQLRFVGEEGPARPLALLGVRACELAAIEIQDQVLGSLDADYAGRREDALIIGVNCEIAGETCFCTSMGTGPELSEGFDLALTEIPDTEHRFVVEVGSERGRAVVEALDLPHADATDLDARAGVIEQCVGSIEKRFDETGVKELLQGNPDHAQWDDVASRCLACGNCTMVCPTCFCSDHTDLTGFDGSIEHRRRWESCFSIEFSTLHGTAVRHSVGARYRQWLSHKLAHWYDQFGMSGCVGCGRCITWCPVGIDLTEEVAAMRVGAAP